MGECDLLVGETRISISGSVDLAFPRCKDSIRERDCRRKDFVSGDAMRGGIAGNGLERPLHNSAFITNAQKGAIDAALRAYLLSVAQQQIIKIFR